MGTVYLTSGHHGLYIRDKEIDLERRVRLDPSWLKWPVKNSHRGNIHASYQKLTAAALRALMALPVDSAVSYHVVGFQQLRQPQRVWGELFLNGPTDVIVGFSHDSRFDNSPHVELYQWLEEHWDRHASEEEIERFWRDWSDPDRWKIFFELKLRQASNELREKAKQMQQQAGALQRKANRVSSLLKR